MARPAAIGMRGCPEAKLAYAPRPAGWARSPTLIRPEAFPTFGWRILPAWLRSFGQVTFIFRRRTWWRWPSKTTSTWKFSVMARCWRSRFLRRAQAGGALRSVGLGIAAGPQSVSLTGVSVNTSGGLGLSAGNGVSSGGGIVTQLGPSIPALDPTVFGIVNFAHTTSPQSNTVSHREHRAGLFYALLPGAICAKLGLRSERDPDLLQPIRQSE